MHAVFRVYIARITFTTLIDRFTSAYLRKVHFGRMNPTGNWSCRLIKVRRRNCRAINNMENLHGSRQRNRRRNRQFALTARGRRPCNSRHFCKKKGCKTLVSKYSTPQDDCQAFFRPEIPFFRVFWQRRAKKNGADPRIVRTRGFLRREKRAYFAARSLMNRPPCTVRFWKPICRAQRVSYQSVIGVRFGVSL